MIQFSNVAKTYHDRTALSSVSFAIERGEMAFLTGSSCAGKSTVLKLAMHIEKPTHGQIIMNQFNVSQLKKRDVPKLRRQIGMIYQNPQLLSNQTIFENVALPLVIGGFCRHEINRRVHAALDKVGLLSKEKLFPLALSGSEQQRLGIARAIVNKPDILLADEPTGNLDRYLSIDILRLFEAFNAVGVTVLIATHDAALIQSMSHRVITLENGKVLCE